MLKSVKKMKMSYIAPVGLMMKTDKCLESEIIQDAAPSKRQTENNLIGQPQLVFLLTALVLSNTSTTNGSFLDCPGKAPLIRHSALK